MGSPGFKGYDYQITATVWIALELFLGQQRSEEILVEPLSEEDIEASITDDTQLQAISTVAARYETEHLYIQIKRRSIGPWQMAGFTDVFVGALRDSIDSRSRKRPYELLEEDPRARYVFLTDAAVNESLVPYRVSGLLLTHSCSTVPSGIKKRAKVSDTVASQFAIFPMQVEELLDYRITDLLLRKGHVPTLRTALCVEALRGDVRDRLLGKRSPAWKFGDVSSTLRQFGGQPFMNPRLAEYVAPLSYSEIEGRLRNQNAVLLVGPPGTGKTLTAEIIAAQSAAEAVNVIRENSPERIRELISKDGRFLFVLSDPWGSARFDDTAPVNWTDELPKLLEFANPDKRFVVTSRADVLRTAIGDVLTAGEQQPDRKHVLSSIAVQLLPEDYDLELRRKILRNKAARLSAWQQDFVSRQETAIIRKLRLPFSIERFVFYVGQRVSPANAALEELLNSADLDTIVNTVRQQIQAWGASYAECATVACALLSTWNPLELEMVNFVTTALADVGLVLELQSFFGHLVACGNVERDGTRIETHPKVIEALEQVIAGKPSAAADTVRKLMSAIAAPAQANPSMEKLLFGILRATQSGRFLVSGEISAPAKNSISQLIEKKLASEKSSLFLAGLREASEFSLDGQLGKLVRQLVVESKGKDRWFRRWVPPAHAELTKEFTSGVVADPTAVNVLKRFIEFFLPRTEVTYPVEKFLEYLQVFPADLSSSFRLSFDALVDSEQVCLNDDLIVAGSLSDDASFGHVGARILQLWESIDTWFAGFDQELSAARECELDVEYSAHLEEEPGEHYGVVEGLAKAYVALRREREGWRWLTEPRNQRFLSAWTEAVATTKVTLSVEEWDVMLEACRESHMREYWFAVKEQKQRNRLAKVPAETFSSRYSAKAFLEAVISIDTNPIATLEQISPSLEICSRATLIIAAAGMSRTELDRNGENISTQLILELLVSTVQNATESNLLVAISDLVSETPFSTIKHKYGTVATGELQKLAGALRDCNAYTRSCIAVVSAVLNEVDDSLLENLLTSSDREVTANAAFAAAVGKRDSLLRSCLHHKHYKVRRTALQDLSQLASPDLMGKFFDMAKDKSAAVRLEVAKTIGNLRWTAGTRTLFELLADTRNYSDDSLTGAWPRFEVARAAAQSIQQMQLDDELERELMEFVERGRKATADPIVRASAILALSNSQKPAAWNLFFRMLNNTLAIGKEPAPRYVLRCAAAEAIASFLSRTPTPLTDQEAESLLRNCHVQDPALSVRATVAAALSFGSTSEKFRKSSGVSKRQAELFITAALASGQPISLEYANILLGNSHALPSLMQTGIAAGATPTIPPEAQLWIDSLDPEEEMARAILYSVNHWLIIASDKPESPWTSDLEPERIGTLTLRSMFGGE